MFGDGPALGWITRTICTICVAASISGVASVGLADESSELARWTWLGIVEAGGDPRDPKIVPGAPLRIEFTAERSALPASGSQILGVGSCAVEANLRLWVGDSVFELARSRNSETCPTLDLAVSLNGPGFSSPWNPALECLGRLDSPDCSVLALRAIGEGWCAPGEVEGPCSRVSVPHGPGYDPVRYWEWATLHLRFADDTVRFPSLWAAAHADGGCAWSYGRFYAGEDLLPPRTPDLSSLPPGEVVVEVPFRNVEFRGRLFAPATSRRRTAWALGGTVVAVHAASTHESFDPAQSLFPLGATLDLDIQLDDSRPTNHDPCGLTSAGQPAPDVHTRIDYGLAPDREFRLEGRLGDFSIVGRNWDGCGPTCESGPRVDFYSKTSHDPLLGWLPERLRLAEAHARALGCDEDVDVLPAECEEPWVDPTNPAPLDTLVVTTGLHWRLRGPDGNDRSAVLAVLLQGPGGSIDPDAPRSDSFETASLRTRRVIAGVPSHAPSHFVEIEIDRLEKIAWRCEPPFFPGDVNGDGAVDAADETRIRESLGARYVGQEQGDLDCDGLVDERDLAIWAGNRRPPLVAPEPTLATGVSLGAWMILYGASRRRAVTG